MWKVGMGVVWLCLGCLVGSAGCAAGEESRLGTAAYCEGLCQAAERCRRVSDRGRCFDSCMANNDSNPSMSEQGGVVFGACVADLDCLSLEDEAAFDACWDAAKFETPVTARTRSFCRVYAESVFECGYTYSVVDCERDYRMWGDDVLELMLDCSRIDGCADRDMCRDMVFG